MSDNRDIVYVEDGVPIYRASGLGVCEEALVGIRQGFTSEDAPEWLQKKYDEGTRWEDHIVAAALEAMEATLEETQATAELTVKLPEESKYALVRGHTDGTCTNEHGTFGIEAKKAGPDMWKKWQQGADVFFAAFPYYAVQLAVYMVGTGRPFIYAVGQWDKDAEEVVDVECRIIIEPPADLDEVYAKIRRVEARAADGDMPNCDGGVTFPCPLYYLHNEPERADETDNTNLREAVEAFLRHRAEEKEAKEAKEREMKLIRELMGSIPDDKVDVGVGVITRYINRSSRMDAEAAKADGVDLNKYKVVKESEAFKVTAAKD